MKRLSLSIFLIILASAVLLVSDLGQRKRKGTHIPEIAILQFSSHVLLEKGVRGFIDGLDERGFHDGQNIHIKIFNPEGDIATTNTIAKEITSGKFDYAVTVSTPALQAVANANQQGNAVQVFALVTDPFAAGVGLDREHPEIHSDNIAGYGTLQPVEKLIETAKKLYPGLDSVGIIWNSAEVNSEVCTIQAREYTKKIGIKLLEATAENTSVVYDAANSLVSRGADALLVSGDNTVFTALDSVVEAANHGKIPVITNSPVSPNKGTLLDIGADYYLVGKNEGYLTVRLLNGEDPSTIPIKNITPDVMYVNKQALKNLKDPWSINDDILSSADLVVDENGNEIAKKKPGDAVTSANSKITKKWNIQVIEFVEISDVEETRTGVLEGLKLAGLKEGKDYTVNIQNAQGDMPTLNLMVDNALSRGADMIVTLSTPTLQAAIQRAKNIPVIFTFCASGVNAGAGRTNEDHLPNITGTYEVQAYKEMLAIVKQLMPRAKKFGTIYVPAETNSVALEKSLREEVEKAGLELVSLPANNPTEVPDTALALVSSGIDSIMQVPGNLTAVSFTSISKAANQAKIPIFAFQTVQADEGAVVVLAKDYFDFGKEAAFLAARVMRGENPKDIPFVGIEVSKFIINLKAAKVSNLKIPEDMIKQAYNVIR